MSSICIQYRSKSAKQPNPANTIVADLHINYWKLPKCVGFERFMDFGLLIHDLPNDLDAISFYLPIRVESCSVKDLGKIVSDSNMTGHLFNADYKVSNVVKSNVFHTAECNDESKPSFLLYSFGKEYSVEQLRSGSRIIITIPQLPEETNLIVQKTEKEERSSYGQFYIRFRLDNIKDSDFGHVEPVSNDFLQSAFSKMEMLNFHINEFREIPIDDSALLQKGWSFFSVSKVHFYFIGSSEDEKVTGHKSYKDSRLLDHNKWSAYLDGHNSKHKQCIAYHWKYEGVDMPNNIFIRTVYSSFQVWKVLKYCAIILLLGYLAGILANLSYDCGKHLLQKTQTEEPSESVTVN